MFTIDYSSIPSLASQLDAATRPRPVSRARPQPSIRAALQEPSPFSASLAAHRLWALSGLPPHLQSPHETLASALRRAAALQLTRPSRRAVAHAFDASISP